MQTDKKVVFVSQRKENTIDPSASDLYQVGTLAVIDRTLRNEKDLNALIRGTSRVRINKLDTSGPLLRASVTIIQDIVIESPELEALSKHLLNSFKEAVNYGKSVEFLNFMKLMSDAGPSQLADHIASTLELSQQKQQILETIDVNTD